MCESVRCGLEVVKSSLFGFLNPRFVVSVAVEYDSLVLLDSFLDKVVERCLEVIRIFKNVCKLLQLFRNGLRRSGIYPDYRRMPEGNLYESLWMDKMDA